MVKLTPISNRAKQRVTTHGDVMHLIDFKVNGNDAEILVESQGKTWHGETWMGWFTLVKDVNKQTLTSDGTPLT